MTCQVTQWIYMVCLHIIWNRYCGKNYSFDISPESGPDVDLVCTLNLLLLSNSSFEEGEGFAAIVGATRRGSLSFRDTLCTTRPLSSSLAHNVLAISSGMQSMVLFCFTVLTSHCFFLWLYLLELISFPDLLVADGRSKWKFQSNLAIYPSLVSFLTAMKKIYTL